MREGSEAVRDLELVEVHSGPEVRAPALRELPGVSTLFAFLVDLVI